MDKLNKLENIILYMKLIMVIVVVPLWADTLYLNTNLLYVLQIIVVYLVKEVFLYKSHYYFIDNIQLYII